MVKRLNDLYRKIQGQNFVNKVLIYSVFAFLSIVIGFLIIKLTIILSEYMFIIFGLSVLYLIHYLGEYGTFPIIKAPKSKVEIILNPTEVARMYVYIFKKIAEIDGFKNLQFSKNELANIVYSNSENTAFITEFQGILPLGDYSNEEKQYLLEIATFHINEFCKTNILGYGIGYIFVHSVEIKKEFSEIPYLAVRIAFATNYEEYLLNFSQHNFTNKASQIDLEEDWG